MFGIKIAFKFYKLIHILSIYTCSSPLNLHLLFSFVPDAIAAAFVRPLAPSTLLWSNIP